MNSKTTGIWFVVAAALALFIFAFQHYLRPAINGPTAVLPNLNLAEVTSVQVIPVNAPEICAVRTNDNWFLNKPLFYPGQTTAIESLLDALQKLVPAPRITAAEMREYTNADAEFGFNHPLTLIITAGKSRWQLIVGNKTAPGNQVYLRVEGIDGAFVVNADWLQWIPRAASDWRDSSLVDTRENNFNSIMLTNNAQGLVIELQRNPTNHLWRMLRPLQARADSEHINDALRRLQSAHVTQFVTDDPKADLSTYGLHPAEMDLWLGTKTNFSTGLHLGQTASDDSSQIYAKRSGWNAVLKTAKEPLAPWFGTVNSFRDTNLVELSEIPGEIEMRFANTNNNFILRRQGSNDWAFVGGKFPADAVNAQLLLQNIANLHIAEFAKDTLTPADLAAYGLSNPGEQIILRNVGQTNPLVQLNFGNIESNKVFVQRSDEPFVYAINFLDFHHLPEGATDLRDRHIWNFNTNDVAQIIIHQDGRTRRILRNGVNQWALAPGSQGVIVGGSIEQAVQQLSQLTAMGWLGVNFAAPEKLGFATNNLQITVELKDGKKFTVDFGQEIPSLQSAAAMVTLNGDRWAFVMKPEIYLFVSTYLTIPPNVP